jgi:hypothetical protein
MPSRAAASIFAARGIALTAGERVRSLLAERDFLFLLAVLVLDRDAQLGLVEPRVGPPCR